MPWRRQTQRLLGPSPPMPRRLLVSSGVHDGGGDDGGRVGGHEAGCRGLEGGHSEVATARLAEVLAATLMRATRPKSALLSVTSSGV